MKAQIGLVLLFFLAVGSGCKKETELRPMADLTLLAGRWVGSNGLEIEFDPSGRQATVTRIPPNYTFKVIVGDIQYKNMEAVDHQTYRGLSRYSSTVGYHMFADVTITVVGDNLHTETNAGSIGGVSVTGQKGQMQRVR